MTAGRWSDSPRPAAAAPADGAPVRLRLPPGEVDDGRARWLGRELRALGFGRARRFVVDLSEIEELTPALVGVLVHAHRRLEWHNASLVVVARDETCERLARIGLACADRDVRAGVA